MQARSIFIAATLALLTPLAGFSQIKTYSTPLLARVSYRSGFVEEPGGAASQICFALYVNGSYLLSRNASAIAPIPGVDLLPLVLRGKLAEEEFARVKGYLDSLDLQTEGGGVVSEGADSVVAEIIHSRGTRYHTWVSSKNEALFPPSVSKLVDWLQNFKPRGAIQVELRDPGMTVCPSAHWKLLEPSVAGLSNGSGALSCTVPRH